MSQKKRINLSIGNQKLLLGKQSYKCANKPGKFCKGLEDYKCPLWQKVNEDRGSFDQSGFELDHIKELAISGDNSLNNFQALCKSCHSVKTKKFLIKKRISNINYGKKIYKQGKHNIYLSKSKNVLPYTVRWSKNRPSDKNRIKNIKNYILENGYIDGTIYLANIDEGLVCYDGNHRREALNLIDKDYDVLINLIDQPSGEYLEKKFQDLNKCVPVLDFYLENDKSLKDLEKMNKITSHFSQLWKEHSKGSSKPRKPNFNQSTLQEKILEILKKDNLEFEKINYDVIVQSVQKYNLEKKANIGKLNINQDIKNKSIKNNCFLFI